MEAGSQNQHPDGKKSIHSLNELIDCISLNNISNSDAFQEFHLTQITKPTHKMEFGLFLPEQNPRNSVTQHCLIPN